MQQILDVWSDLSLQRRLTAVISAGAIVATLIVIARVASAPSMALLYNGLEQGAAGEVVRALEQRGVDHEVRSGAIYVDSTQRDELRLTLASEGLPANGTRGYELLDTLTGFGTTSQMFDAAYWRAKEGELARTIMGSARISNARVHISQVNSNPFQRQFAASASVTVNTMGGALSANQVRAMKFLVASAVAGLEPDNVAVIDGATGLVSSDSGAVDGANNLDRTDQLRQKVQRLLEARVGQGNAVVEISIDTVNETESIRERVFDPASRVAISTDTEQRRNNSTDSGGNDVTVASNLPDGDAANGNSSSSENNETRERVNYEVSETERQVTRGPGEIKRISVAVLVNHVQTADAEGNSTSEPRSEEEIAVLEELVASAVGFEAKRGDKITLRSLEFEPVVLQGSQGAPGLFQISNLDFLSLVQVAILALVTLFLGLFVVKPILTGQRSEPEPLALEGQAVSDSPNLLADQSSAPLLDGGANSTATDILPSQESAVERLRDLIGERQDETVEILRSWMEDGEEKV